MVTIMFQADPKSAPQEIFAKFPRALAVALSPAIARALVALPVNQTSVADLTEPRPSSVTLKGGYFNAHRAVLQWILNCGKAGKTVYFRPGLYTFSQYAKIVISCEQLEVNYLSNQIMGHMQKIASKQVHSAEVEKVFQAVDVPRKIKQMVCESIGNAMWEDRCLAVRAYENLCKKEGMEEFRDGLNKHYDDLERAYYRTPEGRADLLAQQEKAAEKERKNANRIARERGVNPSAVTVLEPGKGIYNVKTEGMRVRNGRGGRPGRVAVKLGQMGVTPASFTGRNSQCQARQTDSSAASATTGATDNTPTFIHPSAFEEVTKKVEDMSVKQ
jgi:hypothetical protein